MVTAYEDVEAEFGRVRGKVFEDEGMLASMGKREADGTRSFLNGWFGLDAGTGAGEFDHHKFHFINQSQDGKTLYIPSICVLCYTFSHSQLLYTTDCAVIDIIS
jgi:hypothetical protein